MESESENAGQDRDRGKEKVTGLIKLTKLTRVALEGYFTRMKEIRRPNTKVWCETNKQHDKRTGALKQLSRFKESGGIIFCSGTDHTTGQGRTRIARHAIWLGLAGGAGVAGAPESTRGAVGVALFIPANSRSGRGPLL